MMKDVRGRPYPKLSDLKPGDVVQVDDGFTCIKPWVRRKVRKDTEGLYIRCAEERHHLEGQLDFDTQTYLIGIYKL